MTTTIPMSAALAVIEPAFSEPEKLALAGFLTGYSGLTLEAYAVDLRQFAWCHRRHLALFAVRRADIELFARNLEAADRARATVTRRLSTIAGLYKYAVEELSLEHSPAVHVRRPRIDYESHTTGLDRNEVGAPLVAAGLGTAAEHALVSLLALNGLRVSEATGADIEALGTERGHRTLAIIRKGGKKAVIPLAPRTARAIDLAVGERREGPIPVPGVPRTHSPGKFAGFTFADNWAARPMMDPGTVTIRPGSEHQTGQVRCGGRGQTRESLHGHWQARRHSSHRGHRPTCRAMRKRAGH